MLTKILIICLLLSVGVSATDITVLDTWDTSVTTDPSITISAGTDRLFVAIWSIEVDRGERLVSLELGGVPMTQIGYVMEPDDSDPGTHNLVDAWYLLDAEIPGGANSLIVTQQNNGGGYPPGEGWAYITYENVDQESPISDTALAQSGSATNLNVTVTTVAGGVAFFAGNQKNSVFATWVPTEQWDIKPNGDFNFSGTHDLHAGGGTVNGDYTVATSAGRMVIIGVELAPADGEEPAEGGWQGQVIPVTIQ